jgi:16S rRNA (cytosine967-C5)-methyltransferase
MTTNDPRRRQQSDLNSDVWSQARRKHSTTESAAELAGAPQNGRQLAYAILQEFDRTDQFVQDIFARLDSQHQLKSSDRALAVDVAAGVVRRFRTLDLVIQSRITRERHRVEPDLWRILRIGAYQLLFARTPDHAAVDSTVELCRDVNRHRWTGFVNGVLRGIGRLISSSPTGIPSPQSIPVQIDQWIFVNEDVLPDPKTDISNWVADAFSLPRFLAVRWSERFSSDVDKLLAICMRTISPPDTSLRVNKVQTTSDSVIQRLTEAGCIVTIGHVPGAICLSSSSSRLESLPGFAEGHWSVQDEAAMSASMLLNPKPGERILDLCAAPGGKTTHLAELSEDQATITACDVATGRLRRIEENASRLKLLSIQTQLIGKDGNSIPNGPFDAALVDVPCSNTGVLNKRPEARWRCDEKSLRELVILQTRLLLQACERVRPGGRVVYSTCSLEPEENRGVVDSVLSALKHYRLVEERLHLPGLPADGAYQALLVRSE